MGEDTVATRVTVALVDDHAVVRAGVRVWIERDPLQRLELVADDSYIDAVLAGPGGSADVLVLDLGLFGESILDRIAELAEARPIVVFSMQSADEMIRAVLDAGASAYLTKDEGADHFIETVLATAENRPYVTPSVARALIGDTRKGRPELSQQERRALVLWFQYPKKQSVAREMGISVTTVDQYLSRVRVKYANMGRPAANKAAMVARAIEDGLVRPELVR